MFGMWERDGKIVDKEHAVERFEEKLHLSSCIDVSAPSSNTTNAFPTG